MINHYYYYLYININNNIILNYDKPNKPAPKTIILL